MELLNSQLKVCKKFISTICKCTTNFSLIVRGSGGLDYPISIILLPSGCPDYSQAATRNKLQKLFEAMWLVTVISNLSSYLNEPN